MSALLRPRLHGLRAQILRASPALDTLRCAALHHGRSASSAASASSGSSVGSSASSSSLAPRALSFAEYRSLKQRTTWRNRLLGIPFGFFGIIATSYVCVTLNPHMFDPNVPPHEIQPIFGLDPIFFSALAGVGGALVGYVVGSAFSGVLWRLVNPKTAHEIDQRDADFIQRIAKHRYGAFAQGEDYYGEKIMTLADYRKWVRQQRKKREMDLAQKA